ncbi:MAG: hypothetical protein LUG99_21815 [Lachnospiraceae bacterium]|nr:hypothetical protein [Lachnospiraceae bacterium]
MSDTRRITRKDYYSVVDYARYEGVHRILTLIAAMSDGEDVEKIRQLPYDMNLLNEMYKKYNITRWMSDLTYRVNTICLNCGEENLYFEVQISEDEQSQVEEFYDANKNCHPIRMILEGNTPLSVARKFKCSCCNTVFEASVPIARECYCGRKTGAMQDKELLDNW